MQTENEKEIYAVYTDDVSSLGMFYRYGNIISLHDAQNDAYYRTRKIVFISESWEVCNTLCVKISELENARFNRINGIDNMWDR